MSENVISPERDALNVLFCPSKTQRYSVLYNIKQRKEVNLFFMSIDQSISHPIVAALLSMHTQYTRPLSLHSRIPSAISTNEAVFYSL